MKSFYYILFSMGALHILGLYTFFRRFQVNLGLCWIMWWVTEKPNNKKMGKIEKVFGKYSRNIHISSSKSISFWFFIGFPPKPQNYYNSLFWMHLYLFSFVLGCGINNVKLLNKIYWILFFYNLSLLNVNQIIW